MCLLQNKSSACRSLQLLKATENGVVSRSYCKKGKDPVWVTRAGTLKNATEMSFDLDLCVLCVLEIDTVLLHI